MALTKPVLRAANLKKKKPVVAESAWKTQIEVFALSGMSYRFWLFLISAADVFKKTDNPPSIWKWLNCIPGQQTQKYWMIFKNCCNKHLRKVVKLTGQSTDKNSKNGVIILAISRIIWRWIFVIAAIITSKTKCQKLEYIYKSLTITINEELIYSSCQQAMPNESV